MSYTDLCRDMEGTCHFAVGLAITTKLTDWVWPDGFRGGFK